jgi:hypothetical protein
MYMRDRFERRVRASAIAIVVLWVLKISIVVGIAIFVISNPEAIGAFFGRLVDSFKGVIQ